MYIIREILIGSPPRAIVHGTAPTFDEALRLVPGEVFMWEEDLQHPNHYDGAATLPNGELFTFAIEPTK